MSVTQVISPLIAMRVILVIRKMLDIFVTSARRAIATIIVIRGIITSTIARVVLALIAIIARPAIIARAGVDAPTVRRVIHAAPSTRGMTATSVLNAVRPARGLILLRTVMI